jgi:hypothetical protein
MVKLMFSNVAGGESISCEPLLLTPVVPIYIGLEMCRSQLHSQLRGLRKKGTLTTRSKKRR